MALGETFLAGYSEQLRAGTIAHPARSGSQSHILNSFEPITSREAFITKLTRSRFLFTNHCLITTSNK